MAAKQTNHDKIMDKLIDIQSSLPLMKDKIERLEDCLKNSNEEYKQIFEVNGYDGRIIGVIEDIKSDLQPLYIARGLGQMIIDGLKEEPKTVKEIDFDILTRK